MTVNTITTKRGDVFDWTFTLTEFSSYAGLSARAQLRAVSGSTGSTRVSSGNGALAAEFAVNCQDNGNGTAAIRLYLSKEQTRTIAPGEYEFDIEITMDNWGPHSTPNIPVTVTKDLTV